AKSFYALPIFIGFRFVCNVLFHNKKETRTNSFIRIRGIGQPTDEISENARAENQCEHQL
ncbi:MAG: hypothetical protein J1E04_05255, partial [Alistipes sp.]|nr:hypothetical protein [Alistipes sp.]